jgi:hypothetical protein
VINADIMVSLAGVELLGIKIRAALASFETAAKYGLEFPSGTNLQAPAWRAVTPGRSPSHSLRRNPRMSRPAEADRRLWSPSVNPERR